MFIQEDFLITYFTEVIYCIISSHKQCGTEVVVLAMAEIG